MNRSSRLKPRKVLLSVSLLAVAAILFAKPWHWFEPEVDFNTEIRPIINGKCISCHGGVKRSGGFSLLFRTEALENAESGKPAVIPGDPDHSEMITRLTHTDPELRMPLNADPLTQDEIDKLKRWIRQGAKWEDHWAYVAPKPVTVPEVSNPRWVKNGIDHFILKRMGQDSLQPAPEADKATLLRRVTLDLLGLPATPEQLAAFEKDKSPNAYEKIVDTLLASPHFGERWASPWLDLARYADTKGYEKDEFRDAWRFRDYVINSFNADKPFDQFTIEQLAGDLLPNPTDEQYTATAFHRMTTNNDEGGTDDEEFRTTAILDRVNTTWEVWQATTMGCVQCHSHPYDPFRNEEYYQFMAYLNNTRDEDTPDDSPFLRSFKPEQEKNLEMIRNWIRTYAPEKEKATKEAAFVHLIKLTEPKFHPHSFDSLTKAALADNKYLTADHSGYARLKAIDLTGKNQLLLRYSAGKTGSSVEFRRDQLDGELLGTLKTKKNGGGWSFQAGAVSLKPTNGKHDVYVVFKDPTVKDKRVATIEWVLFTESLPGAGEKGFSAVQDSMLSLLNVKEKIPVLLENKGDFTRKTQVFNRGNWLVKGKQVQPGVPRSMPALAKQLPNNRLGMAQWLVSKDNPLTARVTVNRFWEQLFGAGLVETAEDFGSQGAKPSHPELLDWLAIQFRDEYKWSMKKILRLMVTSATYRQSSAFTKEKLEKDPSNRLLARGPRFRLPAEQIRDQALAVGGLLSRKMYGKTVMPPQPEGVWQVVYSGLKWKTSTAEDAFRRGIYTFWRRSTPYPSTATFDAPMREICTSRRIRTNTPLQALVTLNDTVFVVAARGLANRMLKEGGSTIENQVRHGYQLAMLKEPTPKKLQALTNLYHRAFQHYQTKPREAADFTGLKEVKDDKFAPMTVVASALLNLDEFVTKE